MKEKYIKPTIEIINLPEEEFFTSSGEDPITYLNALKNGGGSLIEDDDAPGTSSTSGGWF